MASIIRIKRSGTAASAPTPLANGELAYSAAAGTQENGGDRLYIGFGTETNGNASNQFVIGGKYFTDMLDHVHGTLTANSALIVDTDKKIDQLNVDNVTIDSNTISSTNTNGNLLLDPNGTGYVQIVGTNGLVIPVGTTAQQGPAVQGAIRFNSEISQFEGYSGTNWSSLGGVRSVDGLTYITAESSPAASNDTLSFVTDGVERFFIDTDTAEFDATIQVRIDNTAQADANNEGAFIVAGGATIDKNLVVGGDLILTGDVQLATIEVLGDSLFSSATTFNLLNRDNAGSTTEDGPTTVNAFLNAANIVMGASGSLTTVNGDLKINGNDIQSSTATAITLSGADVEVKGDLQVTGNDIKSSSGQVAITLSSQNVNLRNDLDVDGNLNVDGTALIDGATTIGDGAARVNFTVYGAEVSITGSAATTMGVSAATGSAVTYTLQAQNSVGDANLDINVKNAATLDANTISLDAVQDSNFSVNSNSGSTTTLTIDSTNAGVGAANLRVGSDGTDNLFLKVDTLNGTGVIDVQGYNVDITAIDTLDVDADVINVGTSGTTTVEQTAATSIINSDTFTIRGTEGNGDTSAVTIAGSLDVDFIKIDGRTISSTDAANQEIIIDPYPAGGDTGGTVIIKGNLQVDGVTTTINSTEITIDDPIFTLGGDTAPASDDNLDRGIKFQWHDGVDAKVGFFGYDDSASEFVFIADANEATNTFTPATSNVFGNLRFSKLTLVDTTASTTTSSGALVVAGGVGIGGQLNVAGTVNKFTSTQGSSSTTTGAVVIAGGLGLAENIYMGGNLVGAGAATSDIDGFNIDGGTY